MMATMHILFIHQNFPGQFRPLAEYLQQQPNCRVTAICLPTAPGLAGVQRHNYQPTRAASKEVHHYVRPLETQVLYAQAVARVLMAMQESGEKPDVIIAHAGWGEALLAKQVFADVPLLGFFEFFYHAQGADVGFDAEFPAKLDDMFRVHIKNANHLLALQTVDAGITPTAWQRSLFPQEYQPKLRQIHEGIRLENIHPNDAARYTLPNGTTLTRTDEVITYVARNLEPYRGFHILMRAVEKLCQRRPNAQIIIVGGDEVSYGHPPAGAKNWREKMLAEITVDTNRVHFLGKIPYADYLRVLQISRAHIYLTYPFVLSWSLLEAMAAGCVVVGSDTAPVREVIRHGYNGYLVPFFDIQAIVQQIETVLDASPALLQIIRKQARQTVEQHYSAHQGIQEYIGLIRELTGKPIA